MPRGLRKGEKMKKLITIVLTVILLISVTTICASASFEPDVNYAQLMIDAAVKGDIEAGIAAANSRSEKIFALGLSNYYRVVTFEDFYLVAKIITAEYGSNWLPVDDMMIVGEVLFNRVASPEFPNTFAECIYQTNPIQYYSKYNKYFQNLLPREKCCIAAFRLFNGERPLNDPSAVFQSKRVIGSETIIKLIDPTGYYTPTYIGRSNYPELYK